MDRWKDKIVVVTGGTEGLGREIALAFARERAHVVALARDASRLEQFHASAASAVPPLSITGIRADVTSDQSVQAVIAQVLRTFQRIDVWINNVGRSTRVAFEDCPVDNYRELMEINFYSAVRCSLEVLPHLKKTHGSLVNVGSLASRTGWPTVAPYSTSKRALSAFHHQLRLEGPKEIHYLEVCMGPLDRLDAGHRYAAQAQGLEKSAAQPGGGVKLKGISPAWLAKKIERACRKRKTELIVPWFARFFFAFTQLFPNLGDRLLRAIRRSN
jgi:uncharacterized protein